jgi:hypothetical protein
MMNVLHPNLPTNLKEEQAANEVTIIQYQAG